jgi:hypothetical protein
MHFNNTCSQIPGRDTGKVNYCLITNFMQNFKKLSRAEMKKVLGGVELPRCGGDCKSDSDCSKGCSCLGATKGCSTVM